MSIKEKKKNRKNTKKSISLMIVLMYILGGILVTVAIIMLAVMAIGYKEGQDLYADATTQYVAYADMNKLDGYEPSSDNVELEWYDQIDVNLDAIMDSYPEVIGWIWFEDDSICYPIMYSGDNEKYLTTAYDGRYLASGSIFLDELNSTDMNSPYSIIYGHNMLDESMFGSLKNYKKSGHIDQCRYFQIILPGVIYRYEIFAYSDLDPNSDVYYIPDGWGDGFDSKVSQIVAGSYIGVDEVPAYGDYVLNLSTCSAGGRFMVSAKRVAIYVKQ